MMFREWRWNCARNCLISRFVNRLGVFIENSQNLLSITVCFAIHNLRHLWFFNSLNYASQNSWACWVSKWIRFAPKSFTLHKPDKIYIQLSLVLIHLKCKIFTFFSFTTVAFPQFPFWKWNWIMNLRCIFQNAFVMKSRCIFCSKKLDLCYYYSCANKEF